MKKQILIISIGVITITTNNSIYTMFSWFNLKSIATPIATPAETLAWYKSICERKSKAWIWDFLNGTNKAKTAREWLSELNKLDAGEFSTSIILGCKPGDKKGLSGKIYLVAQEFSNITHSTDGDCYELYITWQHNNKEEARFAKCYHELIDYCKDSQRGIISFIARIHKGGLYHL